MVCMSAVVCSIETLRRLGDDDDESGDVNNGISMVMERVESASGLMDGGIDEAVSLTAE